MAQKVIQMRALRKCWHDKHLYNIGDLISVPDGEVKDVPRHFVPVEAFSEAAVNAAEIEDRKSRSVKVKAQKIEE